MATAKRQNRVCKSLRLSALRGSFSYISARLPLSGISLISGVRFLPLNIGLVLARPSAFPGGNLLNSIAAQARAPFTLFTEAGESNVAEDLAALVAGFGYVDAILTEKLATLRLGEPHSDTASEPKLTGKLIK
jgi:hypothetical protein